MKLHCLLKSATIHGGPDTLSGGNKIDKKDDHGAILYRLEKGRKPQWLSEYQRNYFVRII